MSDLLRCADGQGPASAGRSFTLDVAGGHAAGLIFPPSPLFLTPIANTQSIVPVITRRLKAGPGRACLFSDLAEPFGKHLTLRIGVDGGNKFGAGALGEQAQSFGCRRRPAAPGAEIERPGPISSIAARLMASIAASVTHRRKASGAPRRNSTLAPPDAKPRQSGPRSSQPVMAPSWSVCAAHMLP